ncbi:hypothetical protein M422DRAFT_780130 [Sphaerobolus stellatus SS14]|uniref:Extracellular serine-rich protein n=1 Tax=Sphaerobolus stellatus (strain SS14) TaxID=990650 RepID=A0A0C9VJV7_SPHS4|nr:hypothetical protein M422DRAFT_780130 [Sphaerobolus stellatus SS14]
MAYSVVTLLLVSSIFFCIAWCQETIFVNVGDAGSFFTPQVIVARQGDMVSFKWTGAFHSITQSSFENPCTPLEGGFDSGVTGNVNGQPSIDPVWNLTITDDTQPIWFFCKVTHPLPHCTTGMVGAINANVQAGANESFDVFLASAKALTTVPAISSGLPPALTGIGAVAFATPIPSINHTNATTTTTHSSSTSTSSQPATSTSLAPSTTASSGLSSGVKAGIGGGIAGAVVLTALVLLLFMQFRRAAKYRKEAERGSGDIFREKPTPLMPEYAHPLSSYERYNVRPPRAPGSASGISVPESIDPESTTSASAVNVKELAAEIVKNIRGAATNGMPMPGLDAVPEHIIQDSIARGVGTSTSYASQDTSSRNGDSTRSMVTSPQTRQLPIPPPQRPPPSSMHNNRRASMETLPAYVSHHDG